MFVAGRGWRKKGSTVIERVKFRRLNEHAGTTPGYKAEMRILPTEHAAVTILLMRFDYLPRNSGGAFDEKLLKIA
jgi:hypothetical protein